MNDNEHEYDVMEEFIKHIEKWKDEDVYNYQPLYYNVFQDENVISKCENLLVSILRSDGEKAKATLHDLYDLVHSLTEKHVLPVWEEDAKKEAEVDEAFTKYEMKKENENV